MLFPELEPETQAPAQAEGEMPTAYRVLARKYRPSSFAALIGQDVLVRTLTNAIESGRLAQAYMLTGVRGVGKTTTARIIARSLNCIGADGNGGPTIHPCGVCANCVAIAQDRHVDVLEMDAASRTGVDDIRDIIDGVRYGPASARYKIYIIDEVHMLSKNAFNALLKTLEEPPPHTKFIFATTEIRKVPVTVLSRCQRFDLKRVESAVLLDHFRKVAAWEKVAAEEEALALIARAADGSVRDGLSLLDQAIARAQGAITTAEVRAMLGLADRARLIGLFEQLHTGDIAKALAVAEDLRAMGADALLILHDLADITHMLTRAKVAPELLQGNALPELERGLGASLGAQLTLPVLTRSWQMLLKGMEEVQRAPDSHQALEMVLIRLAHAAELPTPADLIKQLQETRGADAVSTALSAPSNGGGSYAMRGGAALAVAAISAQPVARAQPEVESALASSLPELPPLPENFAALVALFDAKREMVLYNHLVHDAHLVNYQPLSLTLRLSPQAPANLAGKVTQKLQEWTGKRWMISLVNEGGAPSLGEEADALKQARWHHAESHPIVQAALTRFKDAKLVDVRQKPALPAEAAEADNALASEAGSGDFITTDDSDDR